MKRTFYYAVFALATILITSCNKTPDLEIDPVPTNETSQIVAELTAFNDSLMLTIPTTKASTGEIMWIVANDLYGAYKGGKVGFKVGSKVGTALGNPIAGGAFGAFIGGVSYGAYKSWKASPSSTSSNTVDFSQVDYPVIADAYSKYCLGESTAIELIYMESEQVQSQVVVSPTVIEKVDLNDNALQVGQQHNVMLAGLQGKLIMADNAITKVGVTRPNLQVYELEERILYSEDMETAFDELYLNNGTFESDETELPDVIMDMYTDLISNYASECMDIVFVINKYSECINNSNELTDDEKESLNMGLATSLYSYNYWVNSK